MKLVLYHGSIIMEDTCSQQGGSIGVATVEGAKKCGNWLIQLVVQCSYFHSACRAHLI